MSITLQTNLAENVRVLRQLRGLSQTELAERCTLSSVYVRQIERGERDIGIGALGLLAKGLDCNPGDLLPGSHHGGVEGFVAAAFKEAPATVQQAILFLIGAPSDSPLRDAILTLIAGEVITPSRYGRPSSHGAGGTRKAAKRPRKRPA